MCARPIKEKVMDAAAITKRASAFVPDNDFFLFIMSILTLLAAVAAFGNAALADTCTAFKGDWKRPARDISKKCERAAGDGRKTVLLSMDGPAGQMALSSIFFAGLLVMAWILLVTVYALNRNASQGLMISAAAFPMCTFCLIIGSMGISIDQNCEDACFDDESAASGWLSLNGVVTGLASIMFLMAIAKIVKVKEERDVAVRFSQKAVEKVMKGLGRPAPAPALEAETETPAPAPAQAAGMPAPAPPAPELNKAGSILGGQEKAPSNFASSEDWSNVFRL